MKTSFLWVLKAKDVKVLASGLAFFVSLSIAAPGGAQTASQKANLALMESHLVKAAQEGKFSGVIQIREKGALIYQKAFGLADHDRRTSLQVQHYFDIGSLSKQITAAAVLRLQEQGKLSLMDPLGKFFDLPAEKAKITLLHLITHRSGLAVLDGADLPNQMSLLNRMNLWNGIPVVYFKTYLDGIALSHPPGTKWEYNNLGYALLAHIVDRVAGMSFEAYVQKEFFHPHQVSCGFEDGRSVPEQWRTYGNYEGRNSYLRAGDLLPGLALRGSTSIVCSAEGLGSWAEALMAKKIFRDNFETYFFLKGLPPEFQTPAPGAYSFGWQIHSPDLVSHTGANGGYEASLILDLKKQISIVTLTNLANSSSDILYLAYSAYSAYAEAK